MRRCKNRLHILSFRYFVKWDPWKQTQRIKQKKKKKILPLFFSVTFSVNKQKKYLFSIVFECFEDSSVCFLSGFLLACNFLYAVSVNWGLISFGIYSVHGIEYAFGAHEYPTTGIFEGEPKQCDGFTFRKTIFIGKTDLGPEEVRAVMEELAGEYRGNAYNLITKNCNHFCNDACIRLTGNPIPSWINRLARIGKRQFGCHFIFFFFFFFWIESLLLC